MRQYRALDLFCGAGGAAKGLQRAGFHVTGVDIKPQKRYCGDEFLQADALLLTLPLLFPINIAPFDFIWASPPCQAFSALRHLSPKKHPNLIIETRRRLMESAIPYVIENVPGAPLGESGCLIMLCGSMFGLQTADGSAELRRHRLFECSFSIPLRPACQHNAPVVGIYGQHVRDRRRTISVAGNAAQDNTLTSNPRSKRSVISVCGSGGPRLSHSPVEVRQTFTTKQAREAMAEWIGRKAMEYLQKGLDEPSLRYRSSAGRQNVSV